MKSTPFKILIIESSNEMNQLLSELLVERGFDLTKVQLIEVAIDKLLHEKVDLVISGNQVNGITGFQVFNKLKYYLVKAGIPFFVSMDSFEIDDLLIGLEIGIDNFLFYPYETAAVIHKVENHLNKKAMLNAFETLHFHEYFSSSSVAMFYMEGDEIEEVNDAFLRLIDFEGKIFAKRDFRQTFCISGNDGNEKLFKRFLSGASDECKLKKISCCKNPENHFDVSFYRGRNDHKSTVFAEVVPSAFSLQHGFLKNENKINIQIGADFKQNPFKLTEREQQILKLSAKGLALKQIALQLGLSQRTVEKHRANIMHKTQTSSIIETMAKIGNRVE